MPSKLSATELIERAHTGASTAGRVFGEPIERDGVTVIPVAVIRGGGGGGAGSATSADDDKPEGEGSGGGFGFTAHPAGVYVVRDGDAHWRPALNVDRIIAGGQLLALAAVLVAGSVLRRHRRRR
ncbi:spore germination protein GerW family protein [Actinoplanes sichuanensis]|uniref:Spore germination protein GerW family protein n=1 Tax=Actinoplanes sichuanensis TaxID=512349 RepID=A0ABW3ZZ87_9ACTN|nr:spore germination protein GerW family protein [Actinoplanes sichuanensis]